MRETDISARICCVSSYSSLSPSSSLVASINVARANPRFSRGFAPFACARRSLRCCCGQDGMRVDGHIDFIRQWLRTNPTQGFKLMKSFGEPQSRSEAPHSLNKGAFAPYLATRKDSDCLSLSLLPSLTLLAPSNQSRETPVKTRALVDSASQCQVQTRRRFVCPL